MSLGDFMNIKIHACVGGTVVREDIRTLQDGVHVVVGTPGRVYDMIQRRALRLDSIRMFTLDEADEMLSRYTHVSYITCLTYQPPLHPPSFPSPLL
jgi:translation initiation factor 4A